MSRLWFKAVVQGCGSRLWFKAVVQGCAQCCPPPHTHTHTATTTTSPVPHQLHAGLLVLEGDGDAQQEDGAHRRQHGCTWLQVRQPDGQLWATLLRQARAGEGRQRHEVRW
jgi:hypothetical protein